MISNFPPSIIDLLVSLTIISGVQFFLVKNVANNLDIFTFPLSTLDPLSEEALDLIEESLWKRLDFLYLLNPLFFITSVNKKKKEKLEQNMTFLCPTLILLKQTS